jgi:magnesium transporter
MAKRKRKNRLSAKSHLPSGSMVYVGQDREQATQIKVIDYNNNQINEIFVDNIDELKTFASSDTISWISVTGIQDSEKIEAICNVFDIHSLVQEDVLNTQQRTKIEEFDHYLFVTFKNLYWDQENACIDSEQISIILAKNCLISFQETNSDLYTEIIKRLHTSMGNIRNRKSDYLLYKILDTAVDQYFILIDKIGDMVEDIEDETMHKPQAGTSQKIQSIKKELMLLSKHILPVREALNKLDSGNQDLIEDRTLKYFRDVYDHTYQAYDTIENHRNLLSDLMNMYFTTMSNRLNQVMKVLTIISTIFMPLSFITGVFGMNFKVFPAIDNPNGYFYFWVISALVTVSMLIYFKKKRWF